jgi:Ca2+-binding RTX toxin-like protein
MQQEGAMTTFIGTNGADTITGSSGGDTILSGNGADVVDGGAGNDTISGGNGNDVIAGGSGNDTLNGDNGDDYLDGGAGTDTVNGGNGKDVVVYVAAENVGESDSYDGGEGTDRLDLVLTQSQANSATVQADIQALLAFMALHPNSSSTFQFSAFDLNVKNFEQLKTVTVLDDGGATQSFTFQQGLTAEFVGGSGVDTLSVTYDGTQITHITSDGQIPNGHLLIDFNNDGRNDVTVSGIEELIVNANDVVVTGDLSHTGLANQTIIYNGNDNNNSFDASAETSNEDVHAFGYGGSDTLIGAGGNDEFTGGAGDDLLKGDTDPLNPSFDRAIYTDATGPITVNLIGAGGL